MNPEYDITCIDLVILSIFSAYKIYLGNYAPRLLSGKTIVVAAVVAIALAIGILAVYAYDSANNGRSDVDGSEARTLAAGLEKKIDDAINIMKATGSEPEVRSVDSLSLISTAQMGIPQDADTAKREVAKRILSEHKDFASIFFLTLEGDLYMGEPFEQQKQLPRLNYSDRDWYQGVSSTDDAYTSSVFMSAAVNEPAIAVAVPVSAPDGGNETAGTIGYWVAIINLDTIESGLKDMQNGDRRMIFVDHNGTEIADSARDPSTKRTELRSFADLQGVRAALAGESGSLTETVDGKDILVSYAPLNAHPHTWAVVVLTPQ
jgi:hypothetical protein